MGLGTIGFVIGSTQNAASFDPEYQILGFYLFRDMDIRDAIAADSEVFKHFQQCMKTKNWV